MKDFLKPEVCGLKLIGKIGKWQASIAFMENAYRQKWHKRREMANIVLTALIVEKHRNTAIGQYKYRKI